MSDFVSREEFEAFVAVLKSYISHSDTLVKKLIKTNEELCFEFEKQREVFEQIIAEDDEYERGTIQ